ncbi:MAG: hypothetical protein WBI55_05775 [Eubacteriales bacterium]|nr:hypothetical protein [Clostridiales bacterium]
MGGGDVCVRTVVAAEVDGFTFNGRIRLINPAGAHNPAGLSLAYKKIDCKTEYFDREPNFTKAQNSKTRID